MSSAKISTSLERFGHLVAEQPRGQAFGHRRLADAGVADEHRVVLAPPRQDLDRALKLLRPADERIEPSGPRALGEVLAVRGQRIARGRRFFLSGRAGGLAGRARHDERRLRDPVGNELQHVEPRDALLGQQDRRVRLRLLQDGGQDVADVRFVTLRALHVDHRGLQHAPERRRLLRLAIAAARQVLDRFVEVVVQLTTQRREIGAARREDAFAVRVVQQRVEQVLEREIRMAPRDRFAVGDVKDGFDGCGEHSIYDCKLKIVNVRLLQRRPSTEIPRLGPAP